MRANWDPAGSTGTTCLTHPNSGSPQKNLRHGSGARGANGATTNGSGKIAQAWSGETPANGRANRDPAGSTGMQTGNMNSGSPKMSSTHGTSANGATTNGYGKTAPAWSGETLANGRANWVPAGCTGTIGHPKNSGSPQMSGLHGTSANGATTNGYGKNAHGWSGETPAIGRQRLTAAGSTGTTGQPKNSGSLARITIHGKSAGMNATTNGTMTIAGAKNGETPANGSTGEFQARRAGSTGTTGGKWNTGSQSTLGMLRVVTESPSDQAAS